MTPPARPDRRDGDCTNNDGAFKSPIFSTGTFKFTFTKAGTYPYNCTLHDGTNGTVVVQDAAGARRSWAAGSPPAAPPVFPPRCLMQV